MQINTPHRGTKGGGGGWSPPPWVSLQDEVYCIGGALLEVSDVTKHGRQDFEIRLKQ